MALWNSCNKKGTIIRVLEKVFFFYAGYAWWLHVEFPTIEHENKDLLEYKVAYSVRIGRPRMIRNEELWTQAGQWLIAEQIKEQNLLVMQWGALRWMCGQDSPWINPKGKCERGSQTLTHLEAHKDKQYVQTVTCLSYPGKLLIVVHIIDGF